MEKNIAIGTDIGGSHISCAAVDIGNGKILRETFIEKPVDNKAKADVIISIWSDALKNVLDKVPVESVKGIGFAMPGPFDYVKGISYIKGVAKYENLYEVNIADAVSGRLHLNGVTGVRFINDATAFAVGESWTGSAAKVEKSLSITLGTGLGSAFIRNHVPVADGPNVPEAGCLYHLPYKEGIADDYFSSRGLVNRYQSLSGRKLNGVAEIAALAGSDTTVHRLFEEFGDNFGLFLAPWIKKFGAEIIVAGGNISNAYHLFGNAFEERLKKEDCRCATAISVLKEDAALLGSAYLFDDLFWNSIHKVLPLM